MSSAAAARTPEPRPTHWLRSPGPRSCSSYSLDEDNEPPPASAGNASTESLSEEPEPGEPAAVVLGGRPVRAERIYQISGGCLPEGKPWAIHTLTTVDGIDFIALSLCDQQFVHFVVGKDVVAGLHGYTFVNHLRHLRNDLIDSLMNSRVVEAQSNLENLFGARTKKISGYRRKQMSKTTSTGTLPLYGELQLPSVSFGTEVAPATTMKILLPRDRRERPVIELSVDTLTYVRIAMLEHGRDDARVRQRLHLSGDPKVFYWEARKCWVGRRKVGGTVRQKNFYCEVTPVKRARRTRFTHEEAREMAISWSHDDEDRDEEPDDASDKEAVEAAAEAPADASDEEAVEAAAEALAEAAAAAPAEDEAKAEATAEAADPNSWYLSCN